MSGDNDNIHGDGNSDAGDNSGDEKKGGFFKRLARGLSKTRGTLAEGVGNLILGEKEISEDVLDELETALLMADVGVEATERIMESLTPRITRRQLNNTVALHAALGDELKALLQPLVKPFSVAVDAKPCVVMFVGVNGAGKTTTLGKIANQLRSEGREIVLAAGDTFRAAAVEQLQVWGERNGVEVIAQGQGADSASVVFDAVEAARARQVDVVLADTAGRLQAKSNLMDELSKVKRVMSRKDPAAPHEVLLVLDGGTGQNALSQLKEFDAAVGVTGLVITKLDGTAKAGVLFALAALNPKPIYFIGVGEGIEDLRPFDADTFVDALLSTNAD